MLKKIIKLGRFQFALPVFMVFSCGSLLAMLSSDGFFNVSRFIFGYLIFFSAQLSVQYSNEYFDFDADRLTIPTFFSGGSKVLRNNYSLKIFSKWISIFLAIVSIILSVLFVSVFKVSIRIIILAVFANLLGWFYTAPPLRFSYRGLGEITIMLIIGIMLPIAGFVTLRDTLDKEIIIILIPLLLCTAMLSIAVEIPDYKADRISGKNNLVSVYGRKTGYLMLTVFSSAAFVYFIIIAVLNMIYGFYRYDINFILLGLVSIPSLVTSFYGSMVNPSERRKITLFINVIIFSLFFILLIFNIHLIILVLSV